MTNSFVITDKNFLLLEEKDLLCDICLEFYQHNKINCEKCKKCICINCCNKMKTLNFSKLRDESSLIISTFQYLCPFCRFENNKIVKDYDKDDIINLLDIEIFKLLSNKLKYNDVNKIYKTIDYKNLEIEKIKKLPKKDELTLFFLQNEIERLKDIEKKNIDLEISIIDCKNNTLKLQTENIFLRKLIDYERNKLTDITSKYNEIVVFFNELKNFYKFFVDNIRNLLNFTKASTIKKDKIFNIINNI